MLLPPTTALPIPFIKQRLIQHSVVLLNSFKPSSSRTYGRIQLGREDSWKTLGPGEGRELTVFSTELRGAVRPKGLQTITSRFPLTLAFASAMSFFFVSGFICMLCMLPSGPWSTSETEGPISDDKGATPCHLICAIKVLDICYA